jgi:mannose-6-phosphate isomerase-like protein (cupin superfamily)
MTAKYVEPTGDQKAGYLHYRRPASPWEIFRKEEGIPCYTGIGVKDSKELPRADWERLGGKGTFIQLVGTNNRTGMFVIEVPARGALKPQHHFWEERYIVLEGRGSTEVWKEESSAKTSFEWQPWSIFSIPINANFQIINATASPAILLAINSAPNMINMFQSKAFIFNNPYNFEERFGGNLEDYWKPAEEFEPHPVQGRAMLKTNLFPDAARCYLPLDNNRGPGYRWVSPNMVGGTSLGGFIAEYPSGRYSKAHHHGSGVNLICLKGKGYTYNWPSAIGLTPWRDGKGDQVLMAEYGPGGVVAAAPTPGQETWFHQHFAIGKEPFRIHAIAAGGGQYSGSEGDMVAGVGAEITDGGRAIPYYLEDPHIRQTYESKLKEEGVEFAMPGEVYTEAGANININYA